MISRIRLRIESNPGERPLDAMTTGNGTVRGSSSRGAVRSARYFLRECATELGKQSTLSHMRIDCSGDPFLVPCERICLLSERRRLVNTRLSSLQDRIGSFFGSSFGLGYARVASGTFGTLPALAFFLVVGSICDPLTEKIILAVGLITSSAFTVVFGEWAERYWGRKDPRQYVTDEVAGFFLTVLLFRTESLWLTALWGFLMTRFCDIVKPPPARRMEQLPFGWGVLLDDLVASLYAAAALHLGAFLVPWAFR
jgi:phosphatidylglycerophosphatase A